MLKATPDSEAWRPLQESSDVFKQELSCVNAPYKGLLGEALKRHPDLLRLYS